MIPFEMVPDTADRKRCRVYSALSATRGSTLAALAAGTHDASRMVTTTRAATATNVCGSVGFTSVQETGDNARQRQRRAETDDDAREREIHKPWPTTMRTTSRRSAPSASRSPISAVRCVTK